VDDEKAARVFLIISAAPLVFLLEIVSCHLVVLATDY